MSAPLPPPLPLPNRSLLKQPSQFNFAAGSSRDDIVYGSERPGYIHPSHELSSTPRGPDVNEQQVSAWMDYMHSKSVRHILCLLNVNELGFFSDSLLETYRQKFKSVTHVDIAGLNQSCALPQIMNCLNHAKEQGEGVLVHCSTGQIRTAYVLALWLHRNYNISVDEAVAEVEKYGQENSATRKPTIEGVLRLLMGASQISLPSLSSLSIGNPKVDNNMYVSFVQMGGTIDKDYPKMFKGYAFEIGEAASKRVLRNVPSSFKFDNVSVCRKDSLEITDSDRLSLISTISKLPATKIIVTHGSDSMIDTAQIVGKSAVSKCKTIVFTGAMKPQKMIDSDAAFNIGAAIGSINVLGFGCYICMNGRIFENTRCRRDGRSGLFEIL